MSTLPDLQVGPPLREQSLSVFPLFAADHSGIDYLLSSEAISSGLLTVKEVSESGSVPELLVENKSASRILFLEGEELRGAKQNRVLNTSVLIAARSSTKIPVSCVEQGRWRFRSAHFESSGTHSSSKLRHYLKASVSRSLREGQGHRSDQGAVWNEVGRQMASLGSHSSTAAMADTYDAHQDRLREYRGHLQYVEGAVGLAVAVGNRVVAIDVFDKPATCQKVWDRLLSGVILDALESSEAESWLQPADVLALLNRLKSTPWESTPTVGEGQEFRADIDAQVHATALVCEGSVLHGSVVLAS